MNCCLQIEAANVAERTVVVKGFATAPLKIANITEDKKAGDARLMIMSSSPGILDGDNYKMNVTVGSNSRLQLQTQSYQRLFTMQHSASQNFEVKVDDGACFTYIPHPLVPHSGANFKATNNIYLKPTSTLIWGDILTCGRNQNGEFFSFSKLHIRTKIFVDSRLRVSENLYLEPLETPCNSLGLWEGYTHQASLIYVNGDQNHSPDLTLVRTVLDAQTGVLAGITSPSANIIIVRLLGHKGELLHNLLQHIAKLLQCRSKRELHYAS